MFFNQLPPNIPCPQIFQKQTAEQLLHVVSNSLVMSNLQGAEQNTVEQR